VCTSLLTLYSGTCINLTSAGTGTNSVIRQGPYIVVSNEQNPTTITTTAKIVKIGYRTAVGNYIDIQGFLSPGLSANSHPALLWTGMMLKTVDSGAFTYDFRVNNGFILMQTRIPADATWYRQGIDSLTRLNTTIEDPAVVGGVVNALVLGYTAGTATTVVTMNSNAQAASITKGNGYVITFSGANDVGAERHNVIYGICNGVGTADGLLANQISFGYLTPAAGSANNIYAGSIIQSYPHMMYSFGNVPPAGYYYFNGAGGYSRKNILPYVSYNYDQYGYHMFSQGLGSVYTSAFFSTDVNALTTCSPRDNGKSIAQKPLMVESSSAEYTNPSRGCNTCIGESENVLLISQNGLTDMELGVNIDGEEWLSIGNSSTIADTTSNYLHMLVPHSLPV
jgi:hypothetical protein